MHRTIIRGFLALLFLSFAANVHAGGSGVNVLVVVNQNSTNSVQLGNYYCEQRQVPPQNVLRINWTGGNIEWSTTDYSNVLLNPLLAFVSTNQLTNQIDYVVLSMDIPYRIAGDANNDGNFNSTTAALFYGYKQDAHDTTMCEIAPSSVNAYAGSEGIFRNTPPSTGANFFLATMITANDLPTAEMVIHQGVIGDSTFPTQSVLLGKSTDIARNVRYSEFDNAIFNTRLRGNYSVIRTNTANPGNNVLLGYQNGSYAFSIGIFPAFVPGAMADNLTSFGGQLFQDTAGQTTALAFAAAGAAGSYGTVTEPCGYQEKFPDAQNYFYQSRGFSIGECYYQSVTNIYEGLVYGEPLAAPFAQRGTGGWTSLASNAVLSGSPNLSLQFTASDAQHPLQQVDLFVDGLFFKTITNIVPQSGNVLRVTLNGFAATYTVPANATIKSVTSGLAGVLNGATYKANTKVSAFIHGDRIELQSTAPFTKTGAQISVTAANTGAVTPVNTFVTSDNFTPTNFLDSVAQGVKQYDVEGTLLANSSVQVTITKTNNTTVSVPVANSGSTNLMAFAQQIVNAVNATASLQGPDGVYADDVQPTSTGGAVFNLYAVGGGYAAAQVKAQVSSLSTVIIQPTGTSTLTDNVDDLQPREHLYVTAGATSLNLTVPLTTTSLTDGYHELEAIAYEGSHVRTQTRASQTILVQNSPLSATLTSALVGANSSPQPTLQLTVTANPNVSAIQLFSTGGLVASAANQSTATFSVNPATLGVGLHPFYAIVTDTIGHQFRTQTQNIRFVSVANNGANIFGFDLPFPLTFTATALQLFWPATAGRSYTVQSTTNLSTAFQTRAVVTPTSSVGQFTESNPSSAQQFYRVSVTP